MLAGARGYVLKLVRGVRLVESLRCVAAGEDLVGDERRATAQAWLREAGSRHASRLTAVQTRVLDLMGQGRTDPQVAEDLAISVDQAAAHVAGVLEVLGFAADSRPARPSAADPPPRRLRQPAWR